jgi:hypothetical protein
MRLATTPSANDSALSGRSPQGLKDAMAAFAEQRPASRIDRPTCADLRKCIRHSIPVNRCSECWPGYLAHLGRLARAPRPKVETQTESVVAK